MTVIQFPQKTNQVICAIPQDCGSVWSAVYKPFQYLGLLEMDKSAFSWDQQARPTAGWERNYGPSHATAPNAPDLIIRVYADDEACLKAMQNREAQFGFLSDYCEGAPIERFGQGANPAYLALPQDMINHHPELSLSLQGWAKKERDYVSPTQQALRELAASGAIRQTGHNRFTV